jgi:uncharacterized protein involved in exopolysaccharide biosynthesis
MLAFKQANPDLSYAGDSHVVTQQLMKLSDALSSARLELLQTTAALESAKQIADDPQRLDQWVRQPGGPGGPLLGEVERLELEIETMQRTLGPQHQSIKGRQDQLESLRARLSKHARESFASYTAALAQRIADEQQREADLQQSFADQRWRSTRSPANTPCWSRTRGGWRSTARCSTAASRTSR